MAIEETLKSAEGTLKEAQQLMGHHTTASLH